MKIGFIGLGAMGAPMAERVVKAGFETFTTFHQRREPADSLAAMGATLLASPAEVARAADTVITILPADAELKDAVFGSGGLLEGFSGGKVLIDMTTATALTLQEIAAALTPMGVRVLDAPVSGGTTAAANGTLTIMVGGPADAFEEVRPIFEAMGKTVTHVGSSGDGQIAKAANQIMVAAQIVAMAELLIFAQKAGADPQKVIEAIRGVAAQCWTLDVKPPRLFSGNRQPGFKASMQAKDLNIVLETAHQYGVPLPTTAVNAQLFNAMIQQGFGDLDNSAVLAIIEALDGVRLKEG